MKLIDLTKNKTAIVDDDLYDILNQYNWCCHNSNYAIRDIVKNGKSRTLFMHRYIFEIQGILIPDNYEVDHINHDKLDNKRDNLRIVTKSQNQYNKQKTTNKTHSKYKGVTYDTNSSGQNK